jgi:hypothetical protein
VTGVELERTTELSLETHQALVGAVAAGGVTLGALQEVVAVDADLQVAGIAADGVGHGRAAEGVDVAVGVAGDDLR